MLTSLVKYAHDQGLQPEPGFNRKTARWAIICDAQGKFLEVAELGDTSLKKNPGLEFRKAPELSQPELVGGKEDRCHFLVETAQVVALYEADEADDKIQAKHRFFVDLICKASAAMPQLRLFAGMLSDEQVLRRIADGLREKKAKPADKMTLQIDGGFPVESDVWHDWWRKYRSELQQSLSAGKQKARSGRKKAENETAMRCLATGELTRPMGTHPKVKGLSGIGGLATGDALICFDKDAFRSYGLEQSSNAAVSEKAAAAYRAALEHLLGNQSHPLAGTKVAHWFARYVPPEDDPVSLIFQGESDPQQERIAQSRAARLLSSIKTGERPDLGNNYYYAITLSGAAGRIMVRAWMEGRFDDLVESVNKWFSALEITNLFGTNSSRAPGIERVITSLLPLRKPNQKYDDWVKQLGSERQNLWRAALCKDSPIPHSALARLVVLNARFLQTGQLEEALEGKSRALMLSLLYTRMGLMKAYHNRNPKGGITMSVALNEDHPHPAYHCGRLMAVLASLQSSALGDVGAGVVQRFYAAASATPALVLGRLTRTSKFHLNKLEPGLAYWYDTKIANVWAKIKDQLPKTLTIEEQSIFALGYYHQIAADRAPKNDKENTTNNEERSNV